MDFLARVEPVIGVERLIQMEIDEEGDDVGPPIDILRITRGEPSGSGANANAVASAQVRCWDCGRPARKAPKARSLWEIAASVFAPSRTFAGGTPAVPANYLSRSKLSECLNLLRLDAITHGYV